MNPTARHELNNVLAALMAEAQLMQMDRLTPDQSIGLDRIVSHARRMRDLLRVAPATEATTDAEAPAP